jgi:hypothetical protein
MSVQGQKPRGPSEPVAGACPKCPESRDRAQERPTLSGDEIDALVAGPAPPRAA